METIDIKPGSTLAAARTKLAAQIYPLPVTIRNDTNYPIVLPRWMVNLKTGEETAKPIKIQDLDAALRLITDLKDMAKADYRLERHASRQS